MRYDLIMFDSDGTLLDFAHSERTAFFLTFKHFGVPVTDEDCENYSRINDSCWKMFERKEITKPELCRLRFSRLADSLGVEYDAMEVNDYYMNMLATDGTMLPETESVLNGLWGKIELTLVTNGTAFVQRGRLADSGIGKYFSHIFISDDLGVQKPDGSFFDLALEKMGRTDRSRILVVGDSLTSDIRGANNAGIDACWYNPQKAPRREGFDIKYEITQLCELFDIV